MRFASLNGLFSAKLENFNYREKVALLTNKPVRKSSPQFDIVLYTRVDQRQDIIDLAQYHIQHIKHNKATNNKWLHVYLRFVVVCSFCSFAYILY